MRGPNADAIKAQCRDAIAPLMSKHGLGETRDIEMDRHGWVNPCFFVNGTHVLRFNARDQHLPKFQREKIALDRLRDSWIPVPRAVILDDSRELVPFDVLISERLLGANLEAHWPTLDEAERRILAEEAGRVVRALQSITFPFFGELSGEGPLPQTGLWWEYLKAKFELHLSEAADLKLFDDETIVRFCEAFSNAKPALKEVRSATLVHGDAHLGNMLFKNNQITALLDFKWACAGDPLYDCSDGTTEPFLRALQSSSFTPSERQRLTLYNLIRSIEVSSVAKRYLSAKEAEGYRSAAIRYLVQAEQT